MCGWSRASCKSTWATLVLRSLRERGCGLCCISESSTSFVLRDLPTKKGMSTQRRVLRIEAGSLYLKAVEDNACYDFFPRTGSSSLNVISLSSINSRHPLPATQLGS